MVFKTESFRSPGICYSEGILRYTHTHTKVPLHGLILLQHETSLNRFTKKLSIFFPLIKRWQTGGNRNLCCSSSSLLPLLCYYVKCTNSGHYKLLGVQAYAHGISLTDYNVTQRCCFHEQHISPATHNSIPTSLELIQPIMFKAILWVLKKCCWGLERIKLTHTWNVFILPSDLCYIPSFAPSLLCKIIKMKNQAPPQFTF